MTKNEELELMEERLRMRQQKHSNHKPNPFAISNDTAGNDFSAGKGISTFRKKIKRVAINGVGLTAISTKKATSLLDTTFKGLLFIADINKDLLNLSDDFAANFNGYTKHPIGDKTFSLALKTVSATEKLAVNGIVKITDASEKLLKNQILHARMCRKVRS